MSKFVFITDLHFKITNSKRTGDLLDELMTKLDWVVSYCNGIGASLLIGGDVFDRPSVPDLVKNRMAVVLSRVEHGIYGIAGNHDRLYDNPEFGEKTSWVTLTSTGLITDLDRGDIDCGDCVLSSTVPVVEKGKPCIFLFHGFLNQEDGRNTFRFTDIESHKSKTLVLLGHDHVVYDDLQYDANTIIVRPGSFQRCTRDVGSERQPQIVVIDVENSGEISYNKVEIPVARDWHNVFITKESGVSVSDVHASYADVISQITNASKTQLSFEDALGMCCSADVVSYMLEVLRLVKENNSYKKQNL